MNGTSASRSPTEFKATAFANTNSVERRRYERVPFFVPLEVTLLPEGVAVPANSFDVSVGGIGIVAGISLQRGQPVRIRFQLKNSAGGISKEDVFGRIAYSKADESGNRLGVEFIERVQESSHPLLARAINNIQ